MASEDNVRCLRYLYLLGDGGSLALREIIIRETSSRSQSLANLLSENKFRFHSSQQVFLQLFQTNEKVNTDIASWGIDVLFHVIKTLFWPSLSPRERSAINTLHSYRVDIDYYGTSVMINDYRTIRADLLTAINDIAQGFDETRGQQLRHIVNRSGAEDQNMHFSLHRVRELNEFPDELLNSLEQRFREVRLSNVSGPNEPSRVHGTISKNIEVEELSHLQYQRNYPARNVISTAEIQNLENQGQQNQEQQMLEPSILHLNHISSEGNVSRSNEQSRVSGTISKNIEVEDSSDLVYQRNIPNTSEDSNAEIQRLEENQDQQNEEQQMLEQSIFHFTTIHTGGEITVPPPDLLFGYSGSSDSAHINDGLSDQTYPKNVQHTIRESEATLTRIGTENAGTEATNNVDEITTSSQIIGNIEGTGITNNADEGNTAFQSVRSSNEDVRVNGMLDLVQELRRLAISTNEERALFWQCIDFKLKVESDSARHADTGQTELIRTINGIISTLDLPEVIRNTEGSPDLFSDHDEQANNLSFQELETYTTLNSHTQETEDIMPNEGQTNTVESSLTDGNQPVLQASSNFITQRVLPDMDIHIADGSPELVENVLSLLVDIYQLGNEGDVHIMGAGEGCVEFMIRCRSYLGIFNLLKFTKSSRFRDHLRGISIALERQLGNPVSLSPYIPEESLRKLESFIAEEYESMPKKRSLALRIKYGSIMDLCRIKQYLQSDKAKQILKSISIALSAFYAGSSKVTSSIDASQMKQAFENRSDRLLCSRRNDLPLISPKMKRDNN